MIEKNSNILYDPRIKRIVEYSEDNKQINILDQRFYRREGKYYPSVSTILNYFPKNKYFYDWLKEVGQNAELIAQKAANEGTQVHNAIERYILGKEINWIDINGNAQYSLDVWRMILKFTDFWKTYKPELIASEYHLFSDKYEYAGTADLIVRLKDKLWLLDIKTSNSLHTSHELQISAYANAWNETHDEKITDIGIIWLKASTRGPDKQNKKIQGDGWQLKTFDKNIETSMEIFMKIYDIYRLENPEDKPYTDLFPLSIKLDV